MFAPFWPFSGGTETTGPFEDFHPKRKGSGNRAYRRGSHGGHHQGDTGKGSRIAAGRAREKARRGARAAQRRAA
jgi:hypothetical protein